MMPARGTRGRTAAWLVALVVTMGSLSWAAVPFYNWFGKVTGYGGTTNVASTGASRVLDRTITVRFDANTDRALQVEFKPVKREITLKIGETGTAYYEAYNPTDRVIAARASYNVTPDQAGYYFNKIKCFCFAERVLQPKERVQMPVVFYVDPAIVDDPEAKAISRVTLSYTFYQIPLPDKQASLTPVKPAPVN